MKQKRHFWSAGTLLIILGAMCAALAILLAIAQPFFLLPALAVLLLAALFAFLCLFQARRALRKAMGGRALAANAGAGGGFAGFSVPIVAVDGDRIVWYNDSFLHGIAAGAESVLLPLKKVVPGIDLRLAGQGQDIAVGEKRYTAYCSQLRAEKNIQFVLFAEDTVLKQQAGEYLQSRPSVLYLVIDTYDEILKEMRESDRAVIVSGIDLTLERFIGKTGGFIRRVTASRYIAVVEERHMQEMVASRFAVLDDVRKAGDDTGSVSLSIGVGRMGATLADCEEMAQQALDMALGRGGDQAAVKSPDGYEFYGGVTHSVEKRTKVKSRIVATAMKDAMARYSRVLVMGHKDSDMDSVGAAVGMLRFCRICHKPTAIVINRHKTMSSAMLDYLAQNGFGEDLVSPQEALALTGPSTLLVVVDTHMRYLLESSEVYDSCGAVIIIDHHRKMVGHLDNAAIFYHEPYASSASELVSELLQYVGDGKEEKPTPVEAEVMLAGIMLDTRTFSLNVGVRTFEASAWLRRMGAQTATVKKLFASSMNDYLYKSHLVSEAKIHHGCAIVVSDKVPAECEVVAPQAANELLSIEGVKASFVGIKVGNVVRISARSMGEVNVQLIMEKIGGGGHLTMAGAQLSDVVLDKAEQMLVSAINAYMDERTDT